MQSAEEERARLASLTGDDHDAQLRRWREAQEAVQAAITAHAVSARTNPYELEQAVKKAVRHPWKDATAAQAEHPAPHLPMPGPDSRHDGGFLICQGAAGTRHAAVLADPPPELVPGASPHDPTRRAAPAGHRQRAAGGTGRAPSCESDPSGPARLPYDQAFRLQLARLVVHGCPALAAHDDRRAPVCCIVVVDEVPADTAQDAFLV
ncbi:hypothetical protein ACFY71_28430 [Streptomyces cinerochromogenes]|uniref:hypothetical protein n=1 Tax=Streptomyces cinerochromogenes TaxID=66422 RepID=UPI0036A7DDCC